MYKCKTLYLKIDLENMDQLIHWSVWLGVGKLRRKHRGRIKGRSLLTSTCSQAPIKNLAKNQKPFSFFSKEEVKELVGHPHKCPPYLANPAGQALFADQGLPDAPVSHTGKQPPRSAAEPSASSSNKLGQAACNTPCRCRHV